MRLALTLTNSCKNKCLKYCRGQKCGFLDLSYLSRDLDRFHRLATVISGLNTAGSKSTWKNVHMHRGKKNSKSSGSGLCTSFALEVNWLSSLYGLLWKVPARQYTAVEKNFQSWIRELRCAYNRRVHFAYPFNVGQMNHLVSLYWIFISNTSLDLIKNTLSTKKTNTAFKHKFVNWINTTSSVKFTHLTCLFSLDHAEKTWVRRKILFCI